MTPVRLLGIDPGLRHTGWGMILSSGHQLRYQASGVISPSDKLPFAERLAQLHLNLMTIIEQYSPHEVAVEEIFVNKNPASTLKLGMARGTLMTVPALKGLPVFEYATNQIKKSVVGVGHAHKDQISLMVGRLLPDARGARLDESDALAVAITQAHFRQTNVKWEKIA